MGTKGMVLAPLQGENKGYVFRLHVDFRVSFGSGRSCLSKIVLPTECLLLTVLIQRL